MLIWFDAHGRHDLPWQQQISPYRIWVSEVMLQQTQVATVIPYFERFMDQFPNVESLASAPLEMVLAQWSGLGYYARGRNLHKASKIVVRDFAAQFPTTQSDLLALPGVGRSTANAILSIAYGKPYAICDGNVKRVLARWLALDLPIEDQKAQVFLWECAQQLQSVNRAAAYTQAIMDLGATLCTKAHPKCHQCPVRQDCNALSSSQAVTLWPKRKPKVAKSIHHVSVYIYLCEDGGVWLESPDKETGIWGGLFQFPKQPLFESPTVKSMPQLKHVFTHQIWHITPYVVKVSAKAKTDWSFGGLWYNPKKDQLSVARPVIVDKLIDQLSLH